MGMKIMENTLFLGNGFTRSVFQNIPSWGDLFEEADSSINNYTILYEAFRLKAGISGKEEDTLQAGLIQKIETTFSDKNIREDICNLENFGQYLFQRRVYNIITTNYDNGIEFILCDTCGYREQAVRGVVPERIFSIRTCKRFINDETGHIVILWKIHGDLSRIKSITLGFDQYCGSLSKLMSYVKGNYESSQSGSKAFCKIPMKTKCKEQKYDNISWIELFFRTSVLAFYLKFQKSKIALLICITTNTKAKRKSLQLLPRCVLFRYPMVQFNLEKTTSITFLTAYAEANHLLLVLLFGERRRACNGQSPSFRANARLFISGAICLGIIARERGC